MNKQDIVNHLLGKKNKKSAIKFAEAFAPANIALCKYWGKRNLELNLPYQSSLSISLGNKGAHTSISISDEKRDRIYVNGKLIDETCNFAQRVIAYINLFRKKQSIYYKIQTRINIPIAAGVASSACGFAALIRALDQLHDWKLDDKSLSILARLGSGSACRSLWHGFVIWQRGATTDGMDSYAAPLLVQWNDLCIGLLVLSKKQKKLSSRLAMQRTVVTSPNYSCWLKKVNQDFQIIYDAVLNKNFQQLGQSTESNAVTLHTIMQTADPPIVYSLPETLRYIQKIIQLRATGLEIYFTQDAGPNLKLLFLKKDTENVKKHFPNIEVIEPFKILYC